MDGLWRQRMLGDESLELRELNERLESYLQRVSLLEQENGVLRGEIQTLAQSPGAAHGKRRELEQGLQCMRAALAEGWGAAGRAALERDRLREEVRLAGQQRAGEERRRARAQGELGEGRRGLEEERRGLEALGRKAQALEGQLRSLAAAHREERERLLRGEGSRPAASPCPLGPPQPPLLALPAGPAELCAQHLGQLCQGSADIYQRELGLAERALAETRGRLDALREERRQSRLRLQALRSELEGLRDRRGLLEERASQQSRSQQDQLAGFQATISLLEQDKESLAAKMDIILEEQHQLMRIKLALSLEVATYRYPGAPFYRAYVHSKIPHTAM
uniref:nestin-like n=1 Tax=Pristiophorus japonicus TaxID=55135 RepID=UPI00398E90A7